MKRKVEEISNNDSHNNSSNNSDVYSRVSTSSKEGRGSLAGWTTCPLCNSSNNTKSQKKFSLGRGISMHLRQVHTPWKPGKGEQARRERIRRIIQGMVYRIFRDLNNSSEQNVIENEDEINNENKNDETPKRSLFTITSGADIDIKRFPKRKSGEIQEEYYQRVLQHELGTVWDRNKKKKNLNWDPSEEEIQEWDNIVTELTQKVEREASSSFPSSSTTNQNDHIDNKEEIEGDNKIDENKVQKRAKFIEAGHDRDGNKAKRYKESLPPFIKAASEGDLQFLKDSIQITKCNDEIQKVLDTQDRNGSIAEHWAAGGGHLECLQYLFDLRSMLLCSKNNNSLPSAESKIVIQNEKKKRKRDGKTCLHYTARNGHNHIIDYLLTRQGISGNDSSDGDKTPCHRKYDVDILTNDGTTPLHLACYGGHLSTIKHFTIEYKANLFSANEWGCGIGHWIAMTVQTDADQTVACLNFIKQSILGNDRINTIKNEDNSSNVNNAKEVEVEKKTTFTLFGLVQKQGHSAVHKAAQKLNHVVIEWLVKEARENWTLEQIQQAGKSDVGGNIPSGIWIAMGGDEKISKLMQEFGW